MGWLYTSHTTRKQLIEELTKTSDNAHHRHETLRHCVRGNVMWCKNRYTEKSTGRTETYIECVLLSISNAGAGYKILSEASGPNYVHCPLSYLEGLSEPPEDSFARNWRLKVREYWADRRAKNAQKRKAIQ